jgi:branched-chain amino acid transport system permease protein
VAWGIAFSWREVTGGDDGLRGVPKPTLGIPITDLSGPSAFYLFTLAAFLAALMLMRAIVRSPFGRSLRGIQESASRMEALGYNVWLHKYLAFVVSAGFAGFAGLLFASYKGFVSPEAASILTSAEVLLMVILGGAGTLFGPVVGAFVIILLSNLISAYTARWTLILGALYAVVVLVAPAGIIGELKAALCRRRLVRQ